MDIVKNITGYLNGNQIPVIGFDQPLYTLAKKIQWQWPDKYGEDKYVVLFGPLHIEHTFLKVLGQLLEGSGWSSIITQSGVASSGSAEALLKVIN